MPSRRGFPHRGTAQRRRHIPNTRTCREQPGRWPRGDRAAVSHLTTKRHSKAARQLFSDLGAFDELLRGSLLVAQLSFPRVQGGGLQGPAVGEGQGPRLGQRTVVNGVKVHAGLLFRLAP